MYIAIPVAVSAFAAYGPVHLLLCNLFLFPIFLMRKEDFLTPILAVAAAIFSFLYISATIPTLEESGEATLTLTWFDNVKIDGAKMKGFAETSSGDTIYAIYTLASEQEKTRFLKMNIPSITFTMSGSFRDSEIPSHDYSFDMVKYMRMFGASGIFESATIIQTERKSGIRTRLSEQRWKVKSHIGVAFPETLKVEAEALLIGDRSGMDEELAAKYRTLGITHLFAISGLHVGLLTFLLREILLKATMRKETVDTLLMVLLPLYAIMAGGAPSVWRAVSVTVLVLLASSGRVKVRLDDALGISAVCFILYEPFVLFQPGFQLSYLAACSLVYSSSMLSKSKTAIGLSFLVTSISQLSLYPILLSHFHELSISSFAVNLAYVPLYSIIILPANIVLLITTFVFPKMADILFMVYEPFRGNVGVVTSWISSLPYQLWTPGKPDAIWVSIAIAGVLLFFIRCEEGASIVRSLPFVILPALIIHFTPYMDSSLHVTFLDVGQGDSMVIELPYRKAVYVVDTGGTITFGESNWKTPEKKFEVGRKIVVPYLKGRGITTIDKLIISHADADHMEGADEVLEDLKVDEIHISPGSGFEASMKDILRIAEHKRIPIHSMKEGISWKEGELSFHYVAPSDGKYEGNASSLVLFMKTTGPSLLLTGDMEKEGESQFLQKHGHSDFGTVILKAGHHGSKTSSTDQFVKVLRPELTIFSAGRNNRYGHPHPEVVDTFRKHGLRTMSTAEFGSITVSVKKDGYYVSSMTE
ncbi:DNA internalization-related competence protein ComEC/Rec2 [Sporosarcina sp. JAI121]|uniref:DNA internalization-related competence protein ComEC/Rec2 n=1 Tax=Sporosarcina sp. JAI121 TaxID=2723064 RepID=UPI0015CDA3C7|nr:DNA internalization-related competence protein ComEC/Rec2 [Sporosarcina sp. JAI121]NYF24947.1 competence protein ComEC [Sporosarcina sp. JAI121]